jgi:hypothetical protein
MNGPLWRRFLWCGLVVAAGAPAAAQVPAAAPALVSWSQLAPGCPVTTEMNQAVQVVACGGTGSFVLSRPDASYHSDCAPLDHGSVAPALIPVDPVPPLPAAFPCAGGRCFGHQRGQPWVAVLDWPTEHGWSVAATIQEAADQKVGVELYDLTRAGEISQWVPPVSDLAVLVELCAVAEDARAESDDRPLAVNMSFGRRRAAAGDAGSGSGLEGPIGRVLDDLAKRGIPAVAAAGNDGELLFPAASPGVVSAGALDLSYLQQAGKPRPSTQTPPKAAALMLGYGLYLQSGVKDAYWPAPPGSSYAAALLSGWLGGTLAVGGRLPNPVPGARWTPASTADGGLALTYGGTPLPGSAELSGPRLLLDRALGPAPAAPDSPDSTTGNDHELTGTAPPLPPSSLLFADAGKDPQPGVDLCVPCRGNGGSGGLLDGSGALRLDLSASGGLPAQMDLVAVFLRVGGAVYMFDGSRDPDLLAAVAAGGLARLVLSGVGGILPAGEQPSLVLVVNVGGTAYWHEVPIHLPG